MMDHFVPCEKCGHPHGVRGIGDGEIAAVLGQRDRAMNALLEYGAHTDVCHVNEGLERGCSCGFSAVASELNAGLGCFLLEKKCKKKYT